MFRKNLVIFDRLTKLMERDQIRLVSSQFWIKIGPCLPEFDKKDLLHAIGVTFGGVLKSEVNGEFCRLRIKLNVQKPLRRGIFVSIGNGIEFGSLSSMKNYRHSILVVEDWGMVSKNAQ